MRNKALLLAGWIVLMMAAARPLVAETPGESLLEKAKQMRKPRYEYAMQHGAQISPTADGKSFVITWFPKGSDPDNPPPMIATISGHSGYAFDEFYLWHPFLEKRGYGFLGIQWWLGEGESTGDYFTPREIYRAMDDAFKQRHVKPGSVLLHGFSRGSTNTYSVAALDRSAGNNYFALIVANAGKPNSDYPPVREIEEGRFGERPLEGTHWITCAGAKDPHPERDGIQGMRDAGTWIKKYGGTIELAIEDPEGDHGSFHKNPRNTDAALDIFDKITK